MYLLRLVIGIVLILLFTVAGCRPPVVYESNLEKFDYEVARVGDVYSLSMPELRNMLLAGTHVSRGGVFEVQRVREFIDSLLTDTLSGLKAPQINLEENFEHLRLATGRYRKELNKTFFESITYEASQLDSQEVFDIVESHPDVFHIDRHVLLFQILIAPEHLAGGPDSLRFKGLKGAELQVAAEKWVFELSDRLINPDSFYVAAARYSHDRYTQGINGFVGWTPIGTYLDPFDSVAFSMSVGEISRPYRDQDGWHIIFIKDHMPAGQMPLDRFWPEAVINARQIKVNAAGSKVMDSLRQEMNFEYNDEVLNGYLYYIDRAEWAAILNGIDTITVNDIKGHEEPFRRRFKVENSTPDMKKEMIRLAGETFIIAQAARQRGIDTLPRLVGAREALRHKYQKSILMQQRFDTQWKPDESMVEFYYNQNIDSFQVEKPLTVQHIIAPDKATAEFLRDQAMSGIDMLDLAEEYYPGEPRLRRQLADLGRIGPEDVSPEFYKRALLTPVGETSEPVKTQYGYHIIKLLERKDSRSLQSARIEIASTLKSQHARELLNDYQARLFAEFKPWISDKLHPIHLPPLGDR